MREVLTRVGEVYARAPALGLSEGQAHALAEILVRWPGAALEIDGPLLTARRAGRPDETTALTAVEPRMPFEGADAAGRQDGP